MELECSVPLNVGVSFAPTPSAPPRLGEASDEWLPRSCSCRQQHHLKFLEGRLFCFAERQRENPIQRY